MSLTPIGELAGSIAHQLGQPLTAILNNAQAARRMIRQGNEDRTMVLEALQAIVLDAGRAGDVLRSMHALLQPGLRRHTRVDLNTVVLDSAALTEHRSRRCGISIEFDLDRDLPAVAGDPVQLQQVVLNLAVNGIEATCDTREPRGAITMVTRGREDGYVELEVRDRGCGLPRELEQTMFEPLVTTKPSGTGLGLAVCRRVVGLHGGRLWATPNPERGATFHVRLPIAG